MKISLSHICIPLFLLACQPHAEESDIWHTVETNAEGNKLTPLGKNEGKGDVDDLVNIEVFPNQEFQRIIGFGGAMTESSAHLLTQMNDSIRNGLIEDYFSPNGANYSLIRTHINSSDFSLKSYDYLARENDSLLETFSIKEDADDIIPMLQLAKQVTADGFKIIASPWTASPWMKTNSAWFGGDLKKECYSIWANYFVKYIQAYDSIGLPIWGITVENEPLGNDANWESMHFTPQTMATFVKSHLVPSLKKNQLNPEIYLFDQNKGEELSHWSEELYGDSTLKEITSGMAAHWYSSTFKVYGESLDQTHELAPEKSILHTEACVDAEIPVWQDDSWYWQKNATDWGWDWAPESQKADHPKYIPTYRYARDIIGCMNHWVEGWIDWNIILDRKGGPNHAKNWCIAPIIVDTAAQEVYKTPIYYVLNHFSKYVRPDAYRIGWEKSEDDLLITAFKNPNQEVVVIIFNPLEKSTLYKLSVGEENLNQKISAQAIQTIVLRK